MPITRHSSRARERASERGFTVIEMVVVLAIILILGSMVMLGFRGSKSTSQIKAASAAASTYAEAIEAYMADNGQTPPALGSAAWPTGTRALRVAGPRDAMLAGANGGKPYIAHAPEAVLDGLVDFGASKATAQANSRAYITYTVSGSNYTLLVEQIGPNAKPEFTCAITNAATVPSGAKRCG